VGEGERGTGGGFRLGRDANVEREGRGTDVERGATGRGGAWRASAAGGATRGRRGEEPRVGLACKREREDKRWARLAGSALVGRNGRSARVSSFFSFLFYLKI
jgi:hypothetical protein